MPPSAGAAVLRHARSGLSGTSRVDLSRLAFAVRKESPVGPPGAQRPGVVGDVRRGDTLFVWSTIDEFWVRCTVVEIGAHSNKDEAVRRTTVGKSMT